MKPKNRDIHPDASSDPIELRLRRFARLECSHPLSWQRFYGFIALAHARRLGLSAGDIKKRLIDYGLPEQKATGYSEIYWHCRCVLHIKNKRIAWSHGYTGWMRKDGAPLT